MFARHYQTGAPIPDELLDKLDASSKFNQGFADRGVPGRVLSRHELAHVSATATPASRIADVRAFESPTPCSNSG